MEVGGDVTGRRGRGDEEDLALVGPRGGQLLRHEEEVAVLVARLLLLHARLRVVALQLNHST